MRTKAAKSEARRTAGTAEKAGAEGIIGNAVWGREEGVGGTMAGASVGSMAGLVIGVDAVGCAILSQKVGSLGRGD